MTLFNTFSRSLSASNLSCSFFSTSKSLVRSYAWDTILRASSSIIWKKNQSWVAVHHHGLSIAMAYVCTHFMHIYILDVSIYVSRRGLRVNLWTQTTVFRAVTWHGCIHNLLSLMLILAHVRLFFGTKGPDDLHTRPAQVSLRQTTGTKTSYEQARHHNIRMDTRGTRNTTSTCTVE